jgi:hypothetical protein
MKTLKKDELYQNLQGFLKNKGVELKAGSYAQKIQKSCSLLSDAINTSQQGLTRAKVEIDKKLDQLRQVIHEKTAPSAASAVPPSPETSPPTAGAAGANQTSGPKATSKRPGVRKAPKKRRPSA